MNRESIAEAFRKIQEEICQNLERIDGTGKFSEDKWDREGGGGGTSKVLQNGSVIEKGGVNFSAVYGDVPAFLKSVDMKGGEQFFATGVSIVLHPHNPFVPIIHMNIRYFELSNGKYWFGGGIDLTPHYVSKELASSFHQKLKATCDKFDSDYYRIFKKQADDYFFIPHRNETRGAGGIFFDHLSESENHNKQHLFDFTCAVGKTFIACYEEQVEANRHKPATDRQKQWQLLRRGRYVEFNLVYDKGTKFGLETNGRAESILMSLPVTASWLYNHVPEKNSEEEKTLGLLKKDVDWLKG
ncbi:MAG: oxygen-dependent coproporphyrinogen oxidase [Bacteroidota bacterium]